MPFYPAQVGGRRINDYPVTEHLVLIPNHEKRDFHVVNRLFCEFPSLVVLK